MFINPLIDQSQAEAISNRVLAIAKGEETLPVSDVEFNTVFHSSQPDDNKHGKELGRAVLGELKDTKNSINKITASKVITNLTTAFTALSPLSKSIDQVKPTNLAYFIDRLGSIIGGVFQTLTRAAPEQINQFIKQLSLQ